MGKVTDTCVSAEVLDGTSQAK